MKEKGRRRLSAMMKSKKAVRHVKKTKPVNLQEKKILRFYLSDGLGEIKGYRVGNSVYLSPEGKVSLQEKNMAVLFQYSLHTVANDEPDRQNPVPVIGNVKRLGMTKCNNSAVLEDTSEKVNTIPFIEIEITEEVTETSGPIKDEESSDDLNYTTINRKSHVLRQSCDDDSEEIIYNRKSHDLRRSSRLRQTCAPAEVRYSDEETGDSMDEHGEGLASPSSGSEYEVSETTSSSDEHTRRKRFRSAKRKLSALEEESRDGNVFICCTEAAQAMNSDNIQVDDAVTKRESEFPNESLTVSGPMVNELVMLEQIPMVSESNEPTIEGESELPAEPSAMSSSTVDELIALEQMTATSESNRADMKKMEATQTPHCSIDATEQLCIPSSVSSPASDDVSPPVNLLNINTPAPVDRKRKIIFSNDLKERKKKHGNDDSDGLELIPRLKAEMNIGKDDSALRNVNMLSWLIDTGNLIENEIVICKLKKKKPGRPLRGLVTRQGIRCNCCKKVISPVEFEAHVGRGVCRPWTNICLLSGKSLDDCRVEAWDNECKKRQLNINEEHSGPEPSDDYCSVCGDGGDLLCCDSCPSAFHQDCTLLKTVPDEHWYCPYCICKFCKLGGQTSTLGSWATPLYSCNQCRHKYHLKCAWKNGMPWMSGGSAKFCTTSCQKIDAGLSDLVGVINPIQDGLSWTLLKSLNKEGMLQTDQRLSTTECNIKLSLALSVLNECYYPVSDPQTGVDMLSQAVYSCRSKFNRLSCEGFYTAILERGEEMISVASIRIHGSCLAEIPFIGTRVIFRKQHMCQHLLSAVQNMLSSLYVKRLVVPCIPDLRKIWTSSFSFMPLDGTLKEEMRNLSLMIFGQIIWLQKSIPDEQSGNQQGNYVSNISSSGLPSTVAGRVLSSSDPKWTAYR